MIGRLTGLPLEDADGALVVDVGGVGYEVLVPQGTVGRAARDEGGRATFLVHTHVREDQITLFGFANEGERLAFRTLIGIPNVGPKTALSVLSALPAAELARAIAAKDVKRLTEVPGIGKKTAERLVLELRDKLPLAGLPSAPPAAAKPGAAAANPREALLSALVKLGYKSVEAERAVAALDAKLDATPLPDLIREALVLLAK
ncbi:MAG TPA: Holliday junction branch migration protein RuvA [Polyangiaceae bacterium]|jgi:Holliday junction DNA helicase RuvA